MPNRPSLPIASAPLWREVHGAMGPWPNGMLPPTGGGVVNNNRIDAHQVHAAALSIHERQQRVIMHANMAQQNGQSNPDTPPMDGQGDQIENPPNNGNNDTMDLIF